MPDDPQIRRLISQMPDFWHAEAKAQVARSIVTGKTAQRMALDAMPDSLDTEINHFFHFRQRGDQMPMTSPSGAAMMPASLNDNYTGSCGGHRTVGGMNFHRRNGNASDQITSAEEFLNSFSALPEEVQLQIFQALASHYGVELEGEAEAEDQELRLPASNGAGVQAGEFFTEQGMSGTWAENDPHGRGPSGTADSRYGYGQRPRNLRQRRRMVSDRMAQDAVPPAERAQAFDRRWGRLTNHVEVWGR